MFCVTKGLECPTEVMKDLFLIFLKQLGQLLVARLFQVQNPSCALEMLDRGRAKH